MLIREDFFITLPTNFGIVGIVFGIVGRVFGRVKTNFGRVAYIFGIVRALIGIVDLDYLETKWSFEKSDDKWCVHYKRLFIFFYLVEIAFIFRTNVNYVGIILYVYGKRF